MPQIELHESQAPGFRRYLSQKFNLKHLILATLNFIDTLAAQNVLILPFYDEVAERVEFFSMAFYFVSHSRCGISFCGDKMSDVVPPLPS